jgi:hypothetical protein
MYSLYEVRYVYICTCSSQYRDAGLAKEIKQLGQQWMPRVKQIFPRVILGTRAIISSALAQLLYKLSYPSTVRESVHLYNFTFILIGALTLVVRSKTCFWNLLIAGIADSNPAEGMDVRLLCLLCM